MAAIILSFLIGGWTIILGLNFYYQAKKDFQKYLEGEQKRTGDEFQQGG
ncbi:hypothetical protein [Brevibacillus fluminis]|nr:hypothetical protein [Brevibacillus fluminis]